MDTISSLEPVEGDYAKSVDLLKNNLTMNFLTSTYIHEFLIQHQFSKKLKGHMHISTETADGVLLH